ncbi:GNAT family N-acetyltransferase [Haladaptatus caseinilyticus]|uniref:GNAT family N-acetyltransferase n=1 Tax=Haladaptatus caseinilyticus TaxID=2993314 RepID=UPI00224AC426|nr:GNAT family N-acetyltransferase [Haladaptatus caseinilyticus]
MIRNAREDDFPGIRTTVQESWIATYSDYLGTDTVRDHVTSSEFYHSEKLNERLTDDEGVVLVVDDDAAGIIGYLYITWNTTDSPYLSANEADLRHIYLHPDHHGEGVGTKLLERGLKALPESIDRVKVLFHPKNDDARAFYAAKKFERDGLLDLDPSKVGMPSSNVDPPEMYVRDLQENPP